ncbi:MAG: gliding motility lipoprotein GldH [Bacteroidales bacterium]|nr:gliding motility lipoprotein GldH [Bacteroidales bacterium]
MKNDITNTKRRHGGGTSAISRALVQPLLHRRWRVKPAMTALLFIGLFLSACTSSNFNMRAVIPEAEWDQNYHIAFDVPVDDTISGYVFGIGLRHLENYRYSNLFVFLHTRMPNGNVTHDTIECTLATPEGRWIGKSSGSMRDLLVPLNENLCFPLSGTYHFEIEQAMREPKLKGISDIGLYIEKQ